MEKIEWCVKQKKGIKIIKPNNEIASSYMNKSMESLEMVSKATKSWKIICSYYACYDILYALFQRYGLKCEIHDCSISLMQVFDKFNLKDIEFMELLKVNRINAQYYVNKKIEDVDVNHVKKFVLKVKEMILNVKEVDIQNVQGVVKKLTIEGGQN